MSVNQIVLQPVEWEELNDIDDIETLCDSDSECVADVRDVLLKHGKLNRFGLTLLHSHFNVAKDECLVEQVDAERRILTTVVKKVEEMDDRSVPTQWKLTAGGVETMATCRAWCEPRPGTTGHWQRHKRTLF